MKRVEGLFAEDKEGPFVFSVSPHDTCSLTNTGRKQENDAFYQRGKVIIKSESMTDIDSALSVLQIGGTSNNLTISNTGALSSLKVGTNNYKLVFLNDVNLVTEHSDAGVY